MSTKTPVEKLFDTLYNAAKNEQSRHSLNSIKKACDTLERHHSQINANTVGKECLISSKGPTPASIRNNKGYMSYIKLRSSTVLVSKTKPGTTPVISDPAISAYLENLKDKLLVSESHVKLLRKYLETQAEPLDIDRFLATQDPVNFGHLMPDDSSEATKFSTPELTLPSELSSPEHLSKFGLEIVKGRICSRATGDVLCKLPHDTTQK